MLQDAKIQSVYFFLLPIAIFGEIWYNIKVNNMKKEVPVVETVISYAMDGANVANIISSELEKLNDSSKMLHNPTLGNYGNVSF